MYVNVINVCHYVLFYSLRRLKNIVVVFVWHTILFTCTCWIIFWKFVGTKLSFFADSSLPIHRYLFLEIRWNKIIVFWGFIATHSLLPICWFAVVQKRFDSATDLLICRRWIKKGMFIVSYLGKTDLFTYFLALQFVQMLLVFVCLSVYVSQFPFEPWIDSDPYNGGSHGRESIIWEPQISRGYANWSMEVWCGCKNGYQQICTLLWV